MPTITRMKELPWPLAGSQRLAWYSRTRSGFVIGNHADKMLVPNDPNVQPSVVAKHSDAYSNKTHAYDELLPQTDYDEQVESGRDGFRFLSRQQYGQAFAGRAWGSTCPVDQAMVTAANLTQEIPVLHSATGSIVSFGNKKITLHAPTPRLEKIGELKARGSIVALLAAPRSGFIFYATHAGDLVQVPISAEQIGKQKKLATFERNVTSIRAAIDGPHLFVGGMGLLATVLAGDNDYQVLAKQEISCRAIEVLNDQWLLVNQGMHGFSLFDVEGGKLRSETSQKPSAPVDQLVCSARGQHLLAIHQPPGGLGLYKINLGD